MQAKPIVYHIPVCPFSQRLEILLELKGCRDAVDFTVVDITRPRDPELLRKTRGTTALPVLETEEGRILKESLVLLDYLDERLGGGAVRRRAPYEHAVEQMLIAKEGPLTGAGYGFVMNQDPDARPAHLERMLKLFAELDAFLVEHAWGRVYLFETFGLAETVFTSLFMRFWFLEYYEGFELPPDAAFDRVSRWREACLAHPAAQQVCREEIVKLYYDYAQGAANGALLPGRARSSFVFEPSWRERPWPPAEKYGPTASDRQLGLT